MQTWLAAFVVVAAIAILLQFVVLFAMYLLFRRIGGSIAKMAESVDAQILPLVHRVRLLMDETHQDLRDIVHESAEVARLVRENSRRFDRVLEEGADRLRQQIIHADRLITGTLEAVEDTVKDLRQSLIEPIRTASALVHGIKAGVNFFRGRSRIPERRREAEDEGLFV